MGKKSKIFYFSVLSVNLLCFVLDVLPLNLPFSPFGVSFAVSLVLIGILLLVRAFTLKIDSSMFFGWTLLFLGLLNLISYCIENNLNLYFVNEVRELWPFYFFALSFSSLFTALYFKDKLQFKLFFLFLGFGLIMLMYIANWFNLGWLIGIEIAFFVAYFVFNIIMYKRKKK